VGKTANKGEKNRTLRNAVDGARSTPHHQAHIAHARALDAVAFAHDVVQHLTTIEQVGSGNKRFVRTRDASTHLGRSAAKVEAAIASIIVGARRRHCARRKAPRVEALSAVSDEAQRVAVGRSLRHRRARQQRVFPT
jgi:hypothetical protein